MILYNSLKREKQKFVPLNPPQVNMYVCGPTVYNYLHIGNFRGPVVFNLLRNWLEEEGFKVTYALNFTDVDDKILAKANDENVTPLELSEKYIAAYKEDFAALGLRPHEMNPKVTEHMPEIIHMVEDLIQKQKAYVADKDVLYSIESFPEYGKLSGRNVEDLLAGARVEVDEKKRSPMDFALWKAAKPGETSWSSPWGEGRPGWHIECSAMIQKVFGQSIDIHGGGMDLIFPHHENEIAQSEGSSGEQFVQYWVHWNMINFSGQKMSKSLGNILSLREFLETNHPEIYKYMILSVHYRSVCDFSDEALHRATAGLARIYSCLALCESLLQDFWQSPAFSGLSFQEFSLQKVFSHDLSQQDFTKVLEKMDPAQGKNFEAIYKKASNALSDDLNTPVLMSVLFDLVREVNSKFKRGAKINAIQFWYLTGAVSLIRYFGGQLALFEQPPSEFLKAMDLQLLSVKGIEVSKIEGLIEKRSAARSAKDFALSDQLRAELTELGISVSDTPQGSFWEVVK